MNKTPLPAPYVIEDSDLANLITFTKLYCQQMAVYHPGLKPKLVNEFATNIDQAFATRKKEDVQAFLDTVDKIEKKVDSEKFKAPLFWAAISLSVAVLCIGALLLASPSYVAAGFICLIAGVVGTAIAAMTMSNGQKTKFDQGFFGRCVEMGVYMDLALKPTVVI